MCERSDEGDALLLKSYESGGLEEEKLLNLLAYHIACLFGQGPK